MSGFVPSGPALDDIRERRLAQLQAERAAATQPAEQRRIDREIRALRRPRWWHGLIPTAHW